MYLHSCFDRFVIVLIYFHGGSYSNQCSTVPLITDGILHIDTLFLIHMDCWYNMEEEGNHYQHMDSLILLGDKWSYFS